MRNSETYRAARRNECREVHRTKPGTSWSKIWKLFEISTPIKKQIRYTKRKSATGKRWPIKSETLQQVKG